ncbi:hypothetical protein BEI_1656 [Halomonas beimenensis]|uniref:Uncharacterized protein n=1 Tax=Halomonas beimenensis TaxID=475662 RepID=A0A291P6V6_9GAMM|nr:hypothetical protein BEI_1656 [Halomonas beimenensis]
MMEAAIDALNTAVPCDLHHADNCQFVMWRKYVYVLVISA